MMWLSCDATNCFAATTIKLCMEINLCVVLDDIHFLSFSTLPHSALIHDGYEYVHSELTISDTKVVVLEKWMDINVDVHIHCLWKWKFSLNSTELDLMRIEWIYMRESERVDEDGSVAFQSILMRVKLINCSISRIGSCEIHRRVKSINTERILMLRIFNELGRIMMRFCSMAWQSHPMVSSGSSHKTSKWARQQSAQKAIKFIFNYEFSVFAERKKNSKNISVQCCTLRCCGDRVDFSLWKTTQCSASGMWWISRTREKNSKTTQGNSTPRWKLYTMCRCAAFTAVNFPRARS